MCVACKRQISGCPKGYQLTSAFSREWVASGAAGRCQEERLNEAGKADGRGRKHPST